MARGIRCHQGPSLFEVIEGITAISRLVAKPIIEVDIVVRAVFRPEIAADGYLLVYLQRYIGYSRSPCTSHGRTGSHRELILHHGWLAFVRIHLGVRDLLRKDEALIYCDEDGFDGEEFCI